MSPYIDNNVGGGGLGEANTGSNLGGGTGVFAQKSGTTLQFKSLTSDANITITSNATEIAFSLNNVDGGSFS